VTVVAVVSDGGRPSMVASDGSRESTVVVVCAKFLAKF